MARYEIMTTRGYALLDVASALQKSIRRGDVKLATYMAMELFASNFGNYCWKRLLTVSAEDVEDACTRELVALHYGYTLVNTPKPKEGAKGRIFITKAVIILCKAIKSRESDHAQNIVYTWKIGISDEEINEALRETDNGEFRDFPDYTYDVHTKKGKLSGKTKKTFFLEENECLFPMGEDLFSEHLKMYIGEIKDK